jgi:hypothetical protein
MMRLLRAVALLSCVSFAIAGCGSSGGEEFPRVVALGEGEVFPAIMNSSLGAGENRLVLQITDTQDEPIFGADVTLKLYALDGDDAELTAEVDARFIPTDLSYVDEQSGGVTEPVGESGAYVAYVTFDRAGEWGLKAAVTRDGETHEAPFRFNVLDRTTEPAIGDDAPRSMQQTLANAPSIEEIDSSSPPRSAMHEMTIADGIASGKPTVVAFATPAFCRSRLCAPVMDTVMDPLFERYGAQANFMHIEPFVLRDLRANFAQNPVPATREWRLDSEPWVFVIDGEGKIAGKFEGIVAADEVEAALTAALEAGS